MAFSSSGSFVVVVRYRYALKIHYDNTPLQNTEILTAVKMVIFRSIFFILLNFVSL